jgi:phage terminase large subunit-like protein
LARTTTTSRRSRSSTSSQRSEPSELADFKAFCEGALVLDSGRAFDLEPFQHRMLADYFAGAIETLILISKKNGKTTLMAALALYHLLTTVDAECVIGAAARDQAEIMLRQIRGFIGKSEALQRLMDVSRREVHMKDGEGRIRIMSSDADTGDGVIPTLALVDELHRHKNSDLYGVFRDGLGPRDGRIITISTAGDDEDSALGQMRAKRVFAGRVPQRWNVPVRTVRERGLLDARVGA